MQTDSYSMNMFAYSSPSRFPIVHTGQHSRGGFIEYGPNASLVSLSSSIPTRDPFFHLSFLQNTSFGSHQLYAVPMRIFSQYLIFLRIIQELTNMTASPEAFFCTPLPPYISLPTQLRCQQARAT